MDILPYAETLVSTIHFLFRKNAPEFLGKLFAVTVRMDANDYVSEEEQPTLGGYVHLAIDASSNYVTVLAAFTQRPEDWLDVKNWVRVCEHDSAWREDGVKSTLKHAYAEIIEQSAKKFGLAPEKLSGYISIENMRIAPFEEVLGARLLKDIPDGRGAGITVEV
jgi:hypothetical protein